MEFICLKACGMHLETLPADAVHIQKQTVGGKQNTFVLNHVFIILL
jgi:hypothetical protein